MPKVGIVLLGQFWFLYEVDEPHFTARLSGRNKSRQKKKTTKATDLINDVPKVDRKKLRDIKKIKLMLGNNQCKQFTSSYTHL